MSGCGNNKLFGNIRDNSIRFYQNSLIATEGANMVQKMLLNTMNFPYEQLLRAKITLKPGQCKYLLNHLGLGDNATFLAILANYDSDSVIEAKNFVQYSYYSNPNHIYSFAQMLLLSGNSENRIEQIYLSNPNKNHPVTLDVLVGIIDSDSGFFQNICDIDDKKQSGIVKYKNLRYGDIITWVVGESIAILNPSGIPQAYITIEDINSVEKEDNNIFINDKAVGTIILCFVDEYNAFQAVSILSWLLEDITRDIGQLVPLNDDIPPIITFTEDVFLLDTLLFTPSSPVIYLTSEDGTHFEALPVVLTDYTNNVITKEDWIQYLIISVEDNRDGLITISEDNVIITDEFDNFYNSVNSIGEYIIKFTINDIANNFVNTDLNIKIEVL